MSPPTGQCPDEISLLAIARGVVPSELLTDFDQHVRTCEHCQKHLEAAKREDQREQHTHATAAVPPRDGMTADVSAHRALRSPPVAPERLARGAMVGRYLIVDVLGEGGMGVVYAAYDPELNRKVALKLLQASSAEVMDSKGGGGQARLLREAQALAQLSNPNVVSVYDVGTLGDRVFVAMELVDGQNLRDWMKAGARSWREVLDVYLPAGRGLSAAHQSGLIHRDFKPDNVLLGKDGRVRVMDFGLARHAEKVEAPALPPEFSELETSERSSPLLTPLTQVGQVMGTPAYMAPEQYAGKPADARVDQFAFCVALYEALYRERPFSSKKKAADPERWRIPPPPKSSRVPAWVRKIVLRGLSFEAEQRYPQMDALLDQLSRDPWVARKRALSVAAGALVVVGALGGAAWIQQGRSQKCRGATARLASVWDAPRRAEVERAFVATQRPFAAQAFSVSGAALDQYAAGWARMHQDACEAHHFRGEQTAEVLELRMGCLDQRLEEVRALSELFVKADPDVVEKSVGAASALTPLARCADLEALRARVPPPTDPKVREALAKAQKQIAQVKALFDAGKYKDGLGASEALVKAVEPLGYAPLTADALYLVGVFKERTGDAKGSEEPLHRALWLGLAGRNDEVAARSATKLIRAAEVQADWKQGHLWTSQGAALLARTGHDPVLEGEYLNATGLLLWKEGKLQEARQTLARALELREKALPADHPDLAITLNNLGIVNNDLGDNTASLEYHQRALQIRLRTMGAEHPSTGQSLNNLGNVYIDYGRFEDAHESFSRAAAIFESVLGKDHLRVGTALFNVAATDAVLGRQDRALVTLQRVMEIRQRALGPDHPDVGAALQSLSATARALGDVDGAMNYALATMRLYEKAYGKGHPEVAMGHQSYGEVMLELERYDEALAQFAMVLELRAKQLGLEHPSNVATFAAQGAAHAGKGDRVRAEAAFRKAMDLGERKLSPEHPDVAAAAEALAELLLEDGKVSEAQPLFERSRVIREKTIGKINPETASSYLGIARAAAKAGDLQGARVANARAFEILEQRPRVRPDLVARARLLMAQTLWEEGTERARAHGLAVQAKDGFAKLKKTRELKAAEQWLAAHRL